MSACARSRTRPASGPKTSTIGREGYGRARNISISVRLSATTMRRLSAGNEIGREPRSDIVGDHFRCAAFGVTQAAQAGVALLLAGNVVGDTRECLSGHDNLAGRDLDQRVG